ncbi:tRNA (adenosine(37)-N6)-threonylcarbamoyltransferase complex ATPase subunit type 1 TsaE [Fulvivirga lutea]|uniref:tRNA threonylcarbamoyladenosine biosynthesis protein TsaE n=1 Tax=Fulvivirga lutea TaxID=2810512 RepID=A0A975A2Q9_9BACT|nr:tRNA (adenosine(37)-N6)-threonylcarbamoyltransferase complex ATPase subunit type 1 TsaE [Fulvivirga lutea]QSE99101.1 tRNA (adenosine(37)-N6)-threonylcarbamoyltransferase complex ATPase subunit type 1 TsaE [Fulvivirga lutea]
MVNSALSGLKLVCRDIEELEKVATQIIEFSHGLKFWIFDGQMGAGKTTLIKEICRQLGVQDHVSSPTYSIVNEYLTGNNQTIYHFDFYRINDEEEAMDIGVEEYFDSGNYCFVEWSSKIPSLLPDKNFLNVSIEISDADQRVIELKRHD